MESNRIADEVKMKLLGKKWCTYCEIEVKPVIFISHSDGVPSNVCPHCGYMVVEIKSGHMPTMPANKETK